MTFDDFWEIYPKKVAKGSARKAFAKISASEHKKIVDGIGRYKDSGLWNDWQFIPYPATFLNQERWEDEIESRQNNFIDLTRKDV